MNFLLSLLKVLDLISYEFLCVLYKLYIAYFIQIFFVYFI